MIEVRKLESEDFDNKEFVAPLLKMGNVSKQATLEELREIFESRKSTSETYIALIDGNIVGIGSLLIWNSFTGRKLGLPMDIIVLPEHQNKGVATKIMEVCIAQPVTRVFGPVGKDLIPFYEKFGFQKMDVVYIERVKHGVL